MIISKGMRKMMMELIIGSVFIAFTILMIIILYIIQHFSNKKKKNKPTIKKPTEIFYIKHDLRGMLFQLKTLSEKTNQHKDVLDVCDFLMSNYSIMPGSADYFLIKFSRGKALFFLGKKNWDMQTLTDAEAEFMNLKSYDYDISDKTQLDRRLEELRRYMVTVQNYNEKHGS
jgi:hypothetical protein